MSDSPSLSKTSSNIPQQKQPSPTSRDQATEQQTFQSNPHSSTRQSTSCAKETMSSNSKQEGSAVESSKRSETTHNRKSSVERAMGKAKSKISRRPNSGEPLADDEEDFEREKAKAVEKQRRKDEYERLGLREKTLYGSGGTSKWA